MGNGVFMLLLEYFKAISSYLYIVARLSILSYVAADWPSPDMEKFAAFLDRKAS